MRYLLIAAAFASLLSVAAGCALPDWKPPKQPYLEGYQFSSDEYSQDKWSR